MRIQHLLNGLDEGDRALWRRVVYVAPAVMGLVLFGLSLWAIQQALQQYSLPAVIHSLRSIPGQTVTLAIALTGLNYWVLTGYDALAVRFVRHPLPYRQTAMVSIISYGISNTVGFALLSGSAIRYRFYTAWGFSARAIAKMIAFCHFSFWLGLLTVGGIMFLVQPLAIPDLLSLPFGSVSSLGAGCLAIVVAYLLWNGLGQSSIRIRNWGFPHLPFNLALAQITIAGLAWVVGASVLYVLLASVAPLPYLSFFGIYLLAQFASLFSNVPGGLGVFETVLLLLLSPTIDSATLLGLLLAYRGIHYLIPLAIAMGLLGYYELRQRFSSDDAA